VSTVVVALGGNALTQPGQSGTAGEQWSNAVAMAAAVRAVVENGHRVVITHGNGPQVGNLATQQFTARDVTPAMPLHLMVAMTQGYIGSLIVRALWQALPERRDRLVALVTHTFVEQDDPAFLHPTKPIGGFLGPAEVADAQRRGVAVVEDAGRGVRCVVASPLPVGVLEARAIKTLIDEGFVVVAGGGGGIPTVREAKAVVGAEAVIDKDRVAVLIAASVEADQIAFVTGVDNVLIGFGTTREQPITEMTTKEATTFADRGEFAEGSMLPKVLSAVTFVDGGGTCAVITSATALGAAIEGEAGTRIVRAERV
jgi:carbamate kinase